jgi:hypothetical protein
MTQTICIEQGRTIFVYGICPATAAYGLTVRVPGYRSRGPISISDATRFSRWARCSLVVKALGNKQEGRRFESRWGEI